MYLGCDIRRSGGVLRRELELDILILKQRRCAGAPRVLHYERLTDREPGADLEVIGDHLASSDTKCGVLRPTPRAGSSNCPACGLSPSRTLRLPMYSCPAVQTFKRRARSVGFCDSTRNRAWLEFLRGVVSSKIIGEIHNHLGKRPKIAFVMQRKHLNGLPVLRAVK